MRLLRILFAVLAVPAVVRAQSGGHPLDGLSTAEYWTVYDALEAAGRLTPETKFTSVLLHPPEKSAVLAWKPGQPVPRAADVVLLREGRSYTARVDIAAKRVTAFDELKGAQSAFLSSEMFGADVYIKKDARVIEALRKRGITDLRTVSCSALPVAYRAIPEQAERRVGFGSCSRTHGTYHSWGRSIVVVQMGRRTFCRTVMLPKSAPPWNATPNFRRIFCRASPDEAAGRCYLSLPLVRPHRAGA